MANKMSALNKSGSILLALALVVVVIEGKSISSSSQSADDSVSAVIPSPNQEYGDTSSVYERDDIERRAPLQEVASLVDDQHESAAEAASNEAAVPVYVSPFVRSERQSAAFDPQESSHAPLNYAPRPSASIHLAASAPQTKDLKTSASYGHGHGHHGGHGYDHSGWLDMGAWTGGKGSFGWYADYPVGGKHGYGYGRK